MINILILSAGTRDKVVQYFKEAHCRKRKGNRNGLQPLRTRHL